MKEQRIKRDFGAENFTHKDFVAGVDTPRNPCASAFASDSDIPLAIGAAAKLFVLRQPLVLVMIAGYGVALCNPHCPRNFIKSAALISVRLILPLLVLGSVATNSTTRGYL